MKEVKARRFISQFHKFSQADQDHLKKAMERVLLDPSLDKYKRPYLTPYKQEHPANPQYTIFFEHLEMEDIVLFVWLNDYGCLHTTRKPSEDPCLVEFDKLRKAGQLESYEDAYHLGKLTVKPRFDKPIYIEYEMLDYQVYFHILNDGDTYYSLMLGFHDNEAEDNFNITQHVFKFFLNSFSSHLRIQKQTFEFRIENNVFNNELIDLLKNEHDPSEWKSNQDSDSYYLVLN